MKNFSLIAIIALLLFTSCNHTGGEKSVYDLIPEGAGKVTRIDADAFLKNAGCRINGGKVTLSKPVEGVLNSIADPDERSLFQGFIAASAVLDMKNVVVCTNDNTTAMLCQVTNPSLMEDYLENNASRTEIDGNTVYMTHDIAVMVKDGVAVASPRPEQLVKFCEKAEKAPLSRNQAMVDELSDSSRTMVSLTSKTVNKRRKRGDRDTNKPLSLRTRYVWLTLHERFIEAEIKLIDEMGEPVFLSDYLQPIEPVVLCSVPSRAEALAAIGEPVRFNDLMNDFDAYDSDLIAEAAPMSLLCDMLHGSAVISATPASTATYLKTMTPPAWNITASVGQSTEDSGSIKALLSLFLPQADELRPETVDGQMCYTLGPDLNLYVADEPGMLTMSTDMIADGDPDPAITSLFTDAYFGIVVNVPYKSETMKAFNLPYGPNFTMAGYYDGVRMRLSLNGSNTAIMEALCETCQAVEQGR